uniref:Putative LAGLIDADG homing endonuclease n=1 Tax=Coleochaete scutata TaxID=3125 RepID=A0A5P9NW29_COLSC|nr:putative LAGLIDADG homing endonuclease [Coleochaete scutata]QFU80178.1 putative LAGLIDADG homing endonuclease [Coleochaete scutata]
MDDGTPVSAGVKIATHGFKEEDILFLCNVLKKKYDLLARPHRDGHQFVIYIPKASMARLGCLISAYMVPSMHRKLNGYYFV